jgi:hypothetical protein
LIIFVKAPTPGEVKTRLLPLLSAKQAAWLYQCLVQDTLEVASRLRSIQVVVAYAADHRVPDLAWLDSKPPMFLQNGQTLGERLIKAFQHAFAWHARHVVVIGSDAPDLMTAWIRQAFVALTHDDVVLGPTRDGGYHLIGLNRLYRELFVDMPWSSPELFGQTLDRITHLGVSVRCLEPVADLDTPEDLRRYLARQDLSRRHTRTARYLEHLQLFQ